MPEDQRDAVFLTLRSSLLILNSSFFTIVHSSRRIYMDAPPPRSRFMKLTIIAALIALNAVTAATQSTDVRFDPVFENRQVSVYSLDLPPFRRANVFQNTHDIFWIALQPAQVTVVDRDGESTPVTFAAGDTRFSPSFHMTAVVNDSGGPFRGVLIELKQRGLASSCDCDSASQRVVCGCDRHSSLPPMWAVALGNVVAGGTTLAPGQAFHRTGERADTLLVAISALRLSDDAAHISINLTPGQVVWLPAGAHNLRNVASTPARYVTLEF
jgi:hypothetical protein